MASHFQRKEGWWGVAVTALLCGGFLWWWFQPAPVDARTERDPLYWLELARKEVGRSEPSLGARFEVLVVALSQQRGGSEAVATAIAEDWLPPAWRAALAPPAAGAAPGEDAGAGRLPAPEPAVAPVLAKVAEARQSLDQLEVERGREQFRDAVDLARSLAQPQKDQALWVVAACQARAGLAGDGRETRRHLPAGAGPEVLPAWIIMDLIHADMAAPVLAWLGAHPADAPLVLSDWVAVLRERLVHREAGELASHGPRADPTAIHPAADEVLAGIHRAVEADQLGAARQSARQSTRGPERAAAYLTIARTLAWNAGSPGFGDVGAPVRP